MSRHVRPEEVRAAAEAPAGAEVPAEAPVEVAGKQKGKGWLSPWTLFWVAAVPVGAAVTTTVAFWWWVLHKVGVLG